MYEIWGVFHQGRYHYIKLPEVSKEVTEDAFSALDIDMHGIMLATRLLTVTHEYKWDKQHAASTLYIPPVSFSAFFDPTWDNEVIDAALKQVRDLYRAVWYHHPTVTIFREVSNGKENAA
jgi:hypothetical protein